MFTKTTKEVASLIRTTIDRVGMVMIKLTVYLSQVIIFIFPLQNVTYLTFLHLSE